MRTEAFLIATVLATQAGNHEALQTVVKRAVAKDFRDHMKLVTLSRNCSTVTEKLDRSGKAVQTIPDQEEGHHLNMSVQKLFRNGRYSYAVAGEKTINDRPTLMINFSPGDKPGQPEANFRPDEGLIDRGIDDGLNEVLNNLKGTLYLDEETNGIVKVEGDLTKSIHYAFVWTHSLHFEYERALTFGIWTPARSVTEYKISKGSPWFSSSFRRTTLCTDYREPRH